ncbi:integral membrane protein [Coniochaeta ligniaria NRRL 30616]|uniref:Integral membrane protein n=1 Tax=Coniochaeta ligniaria NRRL 30616 TaxID=1408157 RepID=A0A1J7J967_9PEZI|nr:integral membrane protein [Coniochaeta ligniaria NRRL 30616]
MGNIGRYACVALPFLLTLGAVVAILVAGLAGVADKSLYMFQINTTNLEISPASITNLINSRAAAPVEFHDASLLDPTGDSTDSAADSTTTSVTSDTKSSNITAADLGLNDLYDIGLWGWCYTAQNGTRTCTKPEFNWAQKELNMTTNNLKNLATSAGQSITLPKEITGAIDTFSTIAKWTEVVFIIAVVALGVELFFGIFANCSRAFSCLTFIVASVASVAVCGFAAMATAMSVIVVGAVEASAKFYGVKADFNTKYLAAVWIAAAFAIAAGFFWMFTVCCCKPDHSSRRSGRKRHQDEQGEKLIPVGAYQPITDDHGYNGGYNHGHANPQYGYAPQPRAARRDLAYEPFSHSNV